VRLSFGGDARNLFLVANRGEIWFTLFLSLLSGWSLLVVADTFGFLVSIFESSFADVGLVWLVPSCFGVLAAAVVAVLCFVGVELFGGVR